MVALTVPRATPEPRWPVSSLSGTIRIEFRHPSAAEQPAGPTHRFRSPCRHVPDPAGALRSGRSSGSVGQPSCCGAKGAGAAAENPAGPSDRVRPPLRHVPNAVRDLPPVRAPDEVSLRSSVRGSAHLRRWQCRLGCALVPPGRAATGSATPRAGQEECRTRSAAIDPLAVVGRQRGAVKGLTTGGSLQPERDAMTRVLTGCLVKPVPARPRRHRRRNVQRV
jgi:hypothetical protein